MENIHTTYVLITGATSGIGLELAKVFAKGGENLIIISRKAEDLERVSQEIQKAYSVKVISMQADLSVPAAVQKVYEQCQVQNLQVSTLVNNAGFGSYGIFSDIDMQRQLSMVDLNIRAVTQLTKLFLEQMLLRGSGNILNVASTAAFQPGPLMSVYYASKAYVLSFSESLHNELREKNIFVTCLCPGPTRTNFQNLEKGFSDTRIFSSGSVMDAVTVAKAGYEGLQKNKAVVIPGFLNKLLVFLTRFGPRQLVTAISRWVLEKN